MPQANRRRALFIVITDYPGGAERVTFGLAAELASRPGWRVEVRIVCSKLPDSFSERVLPPNVRVRYGPARSWHLAFPLFPLRLLFRRFDLVFTTHVYTNALLSSLRRLRLMRIGTLIARESTSVFDRWAGARKRRFVRMYGAYGHEDLLIAQTGYMADHIRPWLPARSVAHLRVVPNPVDVAAIQASASAPLDPALLSRLSATPSILFCGRLIAAKQPLLALEALAHAAAAGCPAQLVFVGSGPLENEIRREAARRGLEHKLLFLGQRTNPYSVMVACQYGVLTSAREGFPNVVLEMMACGMRKIVVTPCAGDLDQLPGVTVTAGFAADEIGEALRRPIADGEDCGETYRAAAAARSVPTYLDCLLHLA